jgi:hypothetical protein
MSHRLLSQEELQKLVPSIREAWRTDDTNIFMAMCIRAFIKRGHKPEIIVSTTIVFVREWLVKYLSKNVTATILTDDCRELVLSLVSESVTLAEVLS